MEIRGFVGYILLAFGIIFGTVGSLFSLLRVFTDSNDHSALQKVMALTIAGIFMIHLGYIMMK